MVNLLRKYQQSLMIAITVLVIIAFIWLYNTTQLEKIGRDQIALVYGKPLTRSDVERYQRQFYMAMDLGLTNFADMLGAREQNGFENYLFNQMIAKHEAQKLQIGASDEELFTTIKSLPRFQNRGQFDPALLEKFYRESIGARGFTQVQVEDLIRDAIIIQKLRALIDATNTVPDSEFKALYEQQFGKLEASVVRMKIENFRQGIEISPEDLQKAYDQRKSTLKSEEKRQVKFVKFTISDEAAKNADASAKTQLLQKVADRAQDFAQKMLDKNANFDEVAKSFDVEPQQTELFTKTSPDSDLKGQTLVQAAFMLTQADPNSDALQDDDTFVVMHLEKVEPARDLTFEDAKASLAEQLKEERAAEKLYTKGAEVRNKIAEEMKAGKSFADAAAAQGVKAEKLPAFSMAEPPKDLATSQQVLSKAFDLAPGEVSAFTPDQEGGFIVWLEKRIPADEKKMEQDSALMKMRFALARSNMVFRDWLRLAREEANIQERSQ